MSAFTYPGVYIEELSSGVHTIAGVATSIAAFVGWAPQGPVTQATLVESWTEYQTLYGGLDSRSVLGYAVNQFFANGGQQAYIVRLVWDGSLPPAPGSSPVPCATAVAAGAGSASAAIQAALGTISGRAMLTVGAPVLQSVAITPALLPSIPVGESVTLAATGSFSDGTQSAVAGVSWTPSNPSIVSVTGGGVISGVSPGTATITATSGFLSANISVTVTPATLTDILIGPAIASLAVKQTQQLTATGKYSDGSMQDVTGVATLTATPGADATVVGGLLTGVAAGAVAVAAKWGAISNSSPYNVTIVTNVLTATVLTPAAPTLQTAQTVTFAATQEFSDGSSAPLGGTVAWTSSNPAVATIDPGTGKATAAGVGSTTITATSGAVSASTTLSVTAAALTTISVTPPAASIALKQTQQLKALGVYSDGTTVDLTPSATWTAAPPLDATVVAGLVTAEAVGAVTITAECPWAAGVTGTAAVIVIAAVPVSLKVTPATQSALSGSTVPFTATATNSDGTTTDVTSAATWTSLAPAVATVAGPGLIKAVAGGGSLTLFADNPGAWGNNLRVSVSLLPAPNNNRFNLLVQQASPTGQLQTLESFVNLSVTSTDPQYAVTVIDNDSSYITFVNPATKAAVVPTATPSPTTSAIALAGGADGAVLVPASDQNFEVVLESAFGIHLLDTVDIFNLLCVPAETDGPTIQTLQEYCHTKRAFYIVDAPQLTTVSNLISTGPVGSTAGSITGQYSVNSAYYFPWIQAPDPMFGNRPTLFPPCGFVAGIYAATDASRGVWKAPAGIDASLTGNSGLQYTLTDLQNGSLNIQAVNCLRQFKVYGDVVWGARTLQGNDQAGSEWKYVPIRRLALFLESSLYDGTQWVVFEPNDEPLWSQIRLNVGAFMQDLFLKGAFQGTTPQQAYFVKCDSSNNPQSSIDLGIVNILVGFAPLYPAEFVVIQIQQMAGQTS
jgi:phage tail sheath protein FI